jgi:hypothetical protein
MGKLILAFLLALGLGLTFPESRAVMVEYARPLLNPAYHWMTVQEMNQIVDDLQFHQETRGDLPSGRGQFDEWMNRRYPQAASRHDAWGTRYRLEVRGDVFRVISAGPDGEFGTDDDIVREGARGTARRR